MFRGRNSGRKVGRCRWAHYPSEHNLLAAAIIELTMRSFKLNVPGWSNMTPRSFAATVDGSLERSASRRAGRRRLRRAGRGRGGTAVTGEAAARR